LQSSLEILRLWPWWIAHPPTGVGFQHGSQERVVSGENGPRRDHACCLPSNHIPCRPLPLPHRVHLSAITQGPSHLGFMLSYQGALGFRPCAFAAPLSLPHVNILDPACSIKFHNSISSRSAGCSATLVGGVESTQQLISSESMFKSPVYFRRRLPRQVLYYEVIVRWLLPSLQTCCHGEATSFVH